MERSISIPISTRYIDESAQFQEINVRNSIALLEQEQRIFPFEGVLSGIVFYENETSNIYYKMNY